VLPTLSCSLSCSLALCKRTQPAGTWVVTDIVYVSKAMLRSVRAASPIVLPAQQAMGYRRHCSAYPGQILAECTTETSDCNWTEAS
jgi:hypothetical protein